MRCWVLVALFAASGCDDSPETTTSATSQASTGTGGGAGAGGSAGGGGSGDPSLEGLLIDAAEQPLGGVDVLACMATVCFTQESFANGRFEFTTETPAEIALKTQQNLVMTPRWAPALEPVRIAAGQAVDAGTLYVPELPDGEVMGPETADPQTLLAGDGLELTLRRADLEPMLGDVLYDVAARRIPESHVPVYTELDGKEVIAVFALHPFGAVSSSPIAVRAPSDLPDDAPVTFQTISEIDGSFSEPVLGATSAGYAATDPGAGITHLTYLVITH